MDNEQQQKLQEILSTEKTFEDIGRALSYAITVTKEQNEDVAIFKRKDGFKYKIGFYKRLRYICSS